MSCDYINNKIYQKKDKTDLDFENQLSADPYNLKTWLRYIKNRDEDSLEMVDLLYERCLKIFPFSYKIWNSYLLKKINELEEEKYDSKLTLKCINIFERCLAYMNKVIMNIDYLF